MRTTRAYVDADLAPGREIALPEHAANHLVRVLRLQPGDACVLFNGDGHDYDARISTAGKREVRAMVGGRTAVERESPLALTLLQGVARGEKMDLILQKATELGVHAFAPVFSERSEVRLDENRAGKRLAHWRQVVASACEQCGRARVPAVAAPASLQEALEALAAGTRGLLLDPEGDTTLAGWEFDAGTPLCLAVGPEGGWSPRDREQLRAAGFRGVRLGPRVLRTETAGLAAIAALQVRFGDCA